jgi:hypothetical protein
MTTNYRDKARSDARDTVDYFSAEIVDQILERGKASTDLLNDYPDGDCYHHESHVDQAYNLQEAAELLGQLSDHEETDSGLWEGQSPRDAIATQAAYTFGNAVYSEWFDLIEQINDEAEDIIERFDGDAASLQERCDEIEDGSEETAVARAAGIATLQERLDTLDDRKRKALSKMVASYC